MNYTKIYHAKLIFKNEIVLNHLCHVCKKENEIKFHYVQNSACLATIVYDDVTTEQCFVMVICMDVRHATR